MAENNDAFLKQYGSEESKTDGLQRTSYHFATRAGPLGRAINSSIHRCRRHARRSREIESRRSTEGMSYPKVRRGLFDNEIAVSLSFPERVSGNLPLRSLLLSDRKDDKSAGVPRVHPFVNQLLKLINLEGEVVERRDCGGEYHRVRKKQLPRIVRTR